MSPLLIRAAQALSPSQLRKLFDHRKNVCVSLLLCERTFAMIPLVKQPINHEYACPHIFCDQSEDYFQNKWFPQNSTQSVPRSKPYISCTPLHLFGALTYPFLHMCHRVCMYISSTSYLLVSFTPTRKTLKNVFRIYKTVEHEKNSLKCTRR